MEKTMVGDTSVEMSQKPAAGNASENEGLSSAPMTRSSARVNKRMRLDASLAIEKKDSESAEESETKLCNKELETKSAEAKVPIKPPDIKVNTKTVDQTTNVPSSYAFKSKRSLTWTTEEKDAFFEALNIYGKDFESIQRAFASRARERNFPENAVKTKDQIRFFYYRTWHKLSKYLKFSIEVKRATQELYALINYGELRKIVGLLTKKTCKKLNELIHRGYANVHIRGKVMRVKTPQCPALQKLNKLDEWREDIQLPSRVMVELRPRTLQDWCHVQAVAQNPRVRTILPLQQRLSSLLAFLQLRWRPPLLQHRDKLLNSVLLAKLQLEVRADHSQDQPPVLHIAPPPGVRISLPAFCFAESSSSTSLSLAAYRERLANREAYYRIRTLPRRNRSRADNCKKEESPSNSKGKVIEAMVAAAAAAAASEAKTKAPDTIQDPAESILTKHTALDIPPENIINIETSTDGARVFSKTFSDICTTVTSEAAESSTISASAAADASSAISAKSHSVLGDSTVGTSETSISTPPTTMNCISSDITNTDIPGSSGEKNMHISPKSENKILNKNEPKLGPKVQLGCLRREKAAVKLETVREGWTLESSRAVTIGELYLMFGRESKVQLEYWWEEKTPKNETTVITAEGKVTNIATALQKLSSIATLNYRKSKLQCPCGHICGAPKKNSSRGKTGTKLEKDGVDKSGSGASCSNDKPPPKPKPKPKPAPHRPIPSRMMLPTVQDGVFRRPLLAPSWYRTGTRNTAAEALKAQLEKFRPRYCNRRGRSVRQNRVVVQRMLPLLPKVPNGHAMVALKVIPQNSNQVAGEFIPIGPQLSGYSLPHSSCSPPPSLRIRPGVPGAPHLRMSYRQPPLLPAPRNVLSKVSEKQNFSTSTVASSDASAVESSSTILSSTPSSSISVSVTQSTLLASTPTLTVQTLSACPEEKNSRSITLADNNDHLPAPPSPLSSPPPSISNLLDLELGSTIGDDISLSGVSGLASVSSNTSTSQIFRGLIPEEAPSPSPSHILKEDNDNHWLNSEVGDYSLSSLLGHLESPVKIPTGATSTASTSGEEAHLPDVEAQFQCLMSENSVDYTAKFADLAAKIAASAENKK